MNLLGAAMMVVLCTFAGNALADTSLPRDRGLPVLVKAAIGYVELGTFDENKGTFQATVDVRLRWQDLRLKLPLEKASDPPVALRGDAATARAKEIWLPEGRIANLVGEASRSDSGLRLFPDGRVELLRRISGEFATDYVVSRFPFGTQKLEVRFILDGPTANQAALQYDQDDLDFSRAAQTARLAGWNLRFVDLAVEPAAGWYGASHATITASLEIDRQSGTLIAAIFVPLLATLVIPLLAIWLNRVEDGAFRVETYEMVNIIIGGLFAVIALNFTVSSVFEVLNTGDNPVNRLFALNYVTLAVSLAVNVIVVRFRLVERMFGIYVQEQLYFVLVWAIPLLVLATAAAVILAALA